MDKQSKLDINDVINKPNTLAIIKTKSKILLGAFTTNQFFKVGSQIQCAEKGFLMKYENGNLIVYPLLNDKRGASMLKDSLMYGNKSDLKINFGVGKVESNFGLNGSSYKV